MVNLRSKSKGKAVAPRTAQRMESTIPMIPTSSDDLDLSEVALRKLPRAKLQKLAMAHKVKANMKSNLIIQQLSSLQRPKRTRPAEDDPEEGPSRKRFKSEDEVLISLNPENQVALLHTLPTRDTSAQSSVQGKYPQTPNTGHSAPRSTSPAQAPTALSYDRDLFSSTESEMTEEEQLDFATPVSSRSGTPPAANVIDLERCVTIMQEISAQDATLLKEAEKVRETAAKLRKRARDVRNLVKAERGRRERMEAYFRYWQETGPKWDRKWLYGEQMEPDHNIKPPTIPVGQETQEADGERTGTPVPVRKPNLSSEELKQRREAIVSRQEAEQRQLASENRDN